MNERVNEILDQLTLEEKAGLCSGSDFWHLKSIERLGLTKIMMTDGPHGLRKQKGHTDHVGLSMSIPTTCFPTAVTTASSWDTEVMFEMGQALGEECLEENVSVILGPGANIKRSPLCGRNFEYFSEDPYLAGSMAAAFINGVQSLGVGTSLKHYVMNNQEERRLTIEAVVDERAQREIYLAGFEKAVKDAQPWTVMCSYNKADGDYLSEHKKYLTDILKEEWGHLGLVVTDWGACNDRVEGLKAGQELEMPSSWGHNDEKIIQAVESGVLPIEILDNAVKKIVELILKSQNNKKTGYKYDRDAHHLLARRIAGQSAVLLKNNGILPLQKKEKIAVIGKFAKSPRYQGTGSSIINPIKKDDICKILDEEGIDYIYAAGYNTKTGEPDHILIEKAKKVAAECTTVVIAAGLTDLYESEGFDRRHLELPESHNVLIEEILSVNPNTVVVLMNGAPVEMPWVNGVKGILEAYLGGQAGGGAVVDILFGDVNPSGKLAETFPIKLEDTPCYRYFPGNTRTVEHRESIYVGYRYYDKAGKNVLFPFGFGLSYTKFEYSNLTLEKLGKYDFEVTVTIKNKGMRAGAEAVQLYVVNPVSDIYKAEKELADFGKVYLEPGESKELTLSLNERSFAFYNINIPGWHVEKGIYNIYVGASSKDICLEHEISLEANSSAMVPEYKESAPVYYSLGTDSFEIGEKQFESVLGRKVPPGENPPGAPLTANSMFGETTHKLIGRLFMRVMKSQTAKMVGKSEGDDMESTKKMVSNMLNEMPIRTIGALGADRLPKYFTEGFVTMLNGKFFKGLGLMLKRK